MNRESTSIGRMLWQMVTAILIAVSKLVALLVGWCVKIIGVVLLNIGEVLIKLYKR